MKAEARASARRNSHTMQPQRPPFAAMKAEARASLGALHVIEIHHLTLAAMKAEARALRSARTRLLPRFVRLPSRNEGGGSRLRSVCLVLNRVRDR